MRLSSLNVEMQEDCVQVGLNVFVFHKLLDNVVVRRALGALVRLLDLLGVEAAQCTAQCVPMGLMLVLHLGEKIIN